MPAFIAFSLVSLAAVGGGALILNLMGVLRDKSALEQLSWSFAIGVGVLGWLVFILGVLGKISAPWIGTTCLFLLPGLLILRPALVPGNDIRRIFWPNSRWHAVLVFGIAIVLCFDFFEGLAPPTDGDSLAYHFALPKLFTMSEKLVFVPRANDGAIPLLQQMTYLAAFKLGGERALTLWTMVSGWGASLVFFVVLRHHVTLTSALVMTLVFLTTPAVVYAGGTGQVEIRNAMFVIIAAVAIADALRTGQWRYAVLAGIAAGWYVGSKYPGLLFAFSCGVCLMFQKRWLSHGLAFSLALVVAGGQWYAWNWWHSGDPVFPLLFSWIDYVEGFPWSEAQNVFYHTVYKASENVLPVNPFTAFLYPILATLAPSAAFESSTVGLGPFALLMLPVAIYGAYRHRAKIRQSPLLVYAALCVGGYLLWFFLGPSQRVRFFLPIYPLLLFVFAASISRALTYMPPLKYPVGLAFAGVIIIQIAGHAVFSVNYIKRAVQSESRDMFITRNVGRYPAIQFINKNLDSTRKVLMPFRGLVYLADVPVFYSHPVVEARIETRTNAKDVAVFWQQLAKQGVTHIMNTPSVEISDSASSRLPLFVNQLLAKSCAKEIGRVAVVSVGSRTLPSAQKYFEDIIIVALTPATCGLQTKTIQFSSLHSITH